MTKTKCDACRFFGDHTKLCSCEGRPEGLARRAGAVMSHTKSIRLSTTKGDIRGDVTVASAALTVDPSEIHPGSIGIDITRCPVGWTRCQARQAVRAAVIDGRIRL